MDNNKVKHLEFLQVNISRMNQCSFQLKGWSITIISALLAIYASSINDAGQGNAMYIFIAIIPAIIFWFLDSYYLKQERKFRGIYDDIIDKKMINGEEIIKSFKMPLSNYKGGKYSLLNAMFSITEVLLYLTLIVGLFSAYCLLK
ncbi:hypothetical protein QUF55_04335 [Clostridiaceae bacterium HSG29]|nr:hypothetical protein [Clostridiaceae bacterium HSG29]